MHDIEPFYDWKHLYSSEEDKLSPFYGREYNEFYFTNKIYNYVIHPQWDSMGSETLYLKIIFVDYKKKFAVIELIGEWNDTINNDIMVLKREIVDSLISEGINKFFMICENVYNFHYSDDEYYIEWKEDIESTGGWIVFTGISEIVKIEMDKVNMDYYAHFIEIDNWRNFNPIALEKNIIGNLKKLLK